jgi:molybdopterin molybdotransferase
MLSVDEATARIVAAFQPLEAEPVALKDAIGRTVAADARALCDQPPAPISMMDGYALRSQDCGPRRLIGAAPAGHPFAGMVGQNETVRLFTGSVVPAGADAVLAQEDAAVGENAITFRETPKPGKFIRPQGLDFTAGTVLAETGRCLTARDLALLAAGDVAMVNVHRRPVIAFAATGDELSRPGEPRKPGGVVASSVYGLAPLIAKWGGAARDLGILPDRADIIAGLAAERCDLLVTLGGASVGDHDLVQSALGGKGLALDFWKIAMRPGKPLIFGRLGATPFLGLPGNPVSTLVCALLFLRPAIAAMLGRPTVLPLQHARIAGALPANDARQDYLRATLQWYDGELSARAFPQQDSSMLKILSQADALIVRRPHAPPLMEGDAVEIVLLE